jgi:NAD(P)-dependent dehydrogenase (short-subunit alcohol dehydrogenase family)
MDKSKYISKVEGHALVLGGSGGIGSEIVRALVANGVRTISLTYGRNKKAADDLAAELVPLGVKVYSASIDQSDEAAFKKFLDDAVFANGEEIVIAVNAIGISPNTPLEEQTLDEWRKVFEVNVFGCFASTRAIAERMKAKTVKGSVVLITSTNGINSHSSISAHYDASKAAQGHMMKIIAEEYAPLGIRINGVAPGWIDTAMNDTLPEDERVKEMAKIWSGRFAEPHEIAVFVAFIVGTGGVYTYGQNFMVDGGYR